MDYISKAIFNLKPNAEFSYNDEDYSTIQWDILDGEAPTQKQIDDEIKRIKATEVAEAQSKAAARQAVLDRLGLTADELQVLLG